MADDRLKTLEERTRYEPAEVEGRIFARWEQAGIFSPEPQGSAAENYSIAVPPPNVTGNLHMGHALNASIQDACIRVARMRGRRAKWIFGTDHAGIATQRQVEKRLEAEGTSREEIGREEFIARVWRWREEHGDTIVRQFKALGASLDYRDERFTMDDDYVRAVTHVFAPLREGPDLPRQLPGQLGPRASHGDLGPGGRAADRRGHAVPGGLPARVGLGLGHRGHGPSRDDARRHRDRGEPADERYSGLIGETAILPLVGRRLPIIADDHVDPEFGTGALKITPGTIRRTSRSAARTGSTRSPSSARTAVSPTLRRSASAAWRWTRRRGPWSPSCAPRATSPARSRSSTTCRIRIGRAAASSPSSRCSGSAT